MTGVTVKKAPEDVICLLSDRMKSRDLTMGMSS